jgi:aldehyde dehydrogenase (NAD+)
MYEQSTFFIDGGDRLPATSQRIAVVSPITAEKIGETPAASSADIDAAVAAARKAFDHGPWPKMHPQERAGILRALAAHLRERSGEISALICNEMGAPISFLRASEFAVPTMLEYYAELGESWPYESARDGLAGPARIRQEPVGVVAAIVPWNGPLALMVLKCSAAMMAGCTVVVKPAAETPLDAYFVADACKAVGLPAGVLNIVPGGRDAGEHLVKHPGVDKVSFTGSTAAGRQIASLCGSSLKRCSLELGGKSAAIALEDASPQEVANVAVPLGMAWINGQACAALTRILVPRARHNEFVEALRSRLAGLKVGDPRDPATDIGPLVTERQRDRVQHYIQRGRQEGALVVCGGDSGTQFSHGWYIEPTLFADVRSEMSIAQEEIFGPVGVVIPYDGGDEEAVAIANDSIYGLGGAVFTRDPQRGYAVAKAVRTGIMGINTYYYDLKCPFGGVKASGIGREMGPEGFAGFFELKSIFGYAGPSC